MAEPSVKSEETTASDEDEQVLAGGNMTAVMRVGRTVRRAAGPWTPAIHALLTHLHKSGFTQAPKPLGVDGDDREIITFLEGSVATYPLSDEIRSDDTLRAVASMLRRYHDATADFVAPTDAVWQWPTHEPAEVICHNDFCPYNLIFDEGRLVGVIDFDTASPGPRVWDMAYTAYRFVPLTDPANPDVRFPGVMEQARRLQLFCDSYGMAGIGPKEVLDTSIARLKELMAFIIDSAAAGDPAQHAVLARGDTDIYQRDAAWMAAHNAEIAPTGANHQTSTNRPS